MLERNSYMNKDKDKNGKIMYSWAKDLYPMCRSITGDGVRKTLAYFNKLLPDLKIESVPTGTKAFDWVVPNEWNVRSAYIKDQSGRKIVDFKKNNLHVVGYSEPVNKLVDFSELNNHLHSLPDQPNAIPYVTSYYSKNWGFCISHNQRKLLKKKKYQVVIDSDLKKGNLNYGEIIIKGDEDKEILLSTYICHPSLANDNLSGPIVTASLIKWIQKLKKRRYTYRVIFIPETIGSIVYLSRYLNHLKKNTLTDRVAKNVLNHNVDSYKVYSFLDRGSDERQYCSPGIDLPICSIMRSKYNAYPEYHTSLDNLNFISPTGLQGSYDILKKCIKLINANFIFKTKVLCEPQLSKYNLYPKISSKINYKNGKKLQNFLAYCDGTNDLVNISEKINEDAFDLIKLTQELLKLNLIKKL